MQTNYVQAPWVITEPDPNNSRFILLQNNLTRKRFRLQKDMAGTPIGSGASETWMPFLLAEKLVIDSNEVVNSIEKEFSYHRNGYEKDEQIVTLIPTHACQFACPYCYNQNIRNPNSETRIPASEMAEIIGLNFRKSPAQKWSLHIIGGGEPLLAAKYISEVGTQIREMARKDRRNFELDLVSNGHLLHGEHLLLLLKAGLKKIRVTLDPDHDKSRPLANGQPTFDTILLNLLNLSPSVEIQLGSNVPIGKDKEFQELLDKLEPIRKLVMDFTVSLILTPLESKQSKSGNGVSCMYGKEEVVFLEKLIAMLDSSGFRRKGTMPKIECEAGRLCEKLVINMRGETTCCSGLDGIEDYKTQLVDGVVTGEMDTKLANDEAWRDHCMPGDNPCPYLPLCHAGCRLISISQGSDWWTLNCEKRYFDRLTRYELRRWAQSNN